jgi:peptidoglycan/xylan/chitin deacetylase (PgdA/CDA1 family)
LREAVEVIAPICREKGVPATFFLTTEFLDNRYLGDRHLASLLLERIRGLPDQDRRRILAKVESEWPDAVPPDRDWKGLLLARCPQQRRILNLIADLIGLDQQAWLQQVRPYAESQEIVQLLADGFTIGAHSLSHPFFPQISTDEQVRETVQSLQFLETRFHVNCSAFAFPFGADGVGTDYFAAVQKVRTDTFLFGVGPASPVPGNMLMDRVPLDADPDLPIEATLRRTYAARLELRIRGIRPSVVHGPSPRVPPSARIIG